MVLSGSVRPIVRLLLEPHVILVVVVDPHRPSAIISLREALSTFVHDHQRLRKVLLLTCFILVDTGQAFISDWAERRTDPADAKRGNRWGGRGQFPKQHGGLTQPNWDQNDERQF